MRDVHGSPVLMGLPALCDPKSPKDNALAAAVVLESLLKRDDETLISIVIDVSGVRGGTNPSPLEIIPVLRALSGSLGVNYPERVRNLVVYPVPMSFRWMWNIVKAFLDPVTADKVVLLGNGAPSQGAPWRGCDREQLSRYVDMSTLPDKPLYGFVGAEEREGDRANGGCIPPAIDPANLGHILQG